MSRVISDENWLLYSGAVVTSYPISMACWFNSITNTASQTLMILEASSTTQYLALMARGDISSDPLYAQSAGSSANQAATSTGFYTNTWTHACAVFAAQNSRAVYINGGNKGTNTTDRAVTEPNTTGLGDRPSAPGGTRFLAGQIENAAIWAVELADADVLQLALGACPLSVKPEHLVSYWPLIGNLSPEIEVVNKYEMSLQGTPTKGSWKGVYLPRYRR